MSTALTAVALLVLGAEALACLGAWLGPLPELAARRGLLVAEAVVALVVLADLAGVAAGHRPESLLTHVGYAAAAVGLTPLLAHRPPAPGEEPADPPHVAVLLLATVATVVLVLRLHQTW